MYRRIVRKPPPPVFPKTLEELGFTIREDKRLVDKEGKLYSFDLRAKNRENEELHGKALNEAVLRVTNQRLEEECGLVKQVVPLGIPPEEEKTSPHAHILVSHDLHKCKRILVLAPGIMEPLGGWSRRLVCNYTTEGGSVYSVVKKAHDEGFGIVILNPNAQYWVDGQAEVQNPANRKQHILIPNLESPEKHVSYVLGNILRPTPCKEFFFIGHKYGCHSLMTALLEQFETFKNRVSAIALIEGTNSLHDETLKDFRKWWSLNAVGYAQSEVSEKGIIDYNVRMGCNCVRAGTEEFDATLLEAMPLINRFFAKRLDRDNTFDRYKDVLQPPVEDDPTTALITFDAEEMEPDETWPVDPEEADASWT